MMDKMDELQMTCPDAHTVGETVRRLQIRYPFLHVRTLGCSVLGRPVYGLQLGEEREQVLFAGAFHGMEWLTCALLLQFTADFCFALDTGCELAGMDVRRAFRGRGLTVVPCVNPDGVEIALHGADSAMHLRDAVLQMSGGDPGRWQANAHGVDLNHNFDAGWHLLRRMECEAGITGPGPTRFGGDCPESEPESWLMAALCRSVPFRHILAFHSQGEEIYWHYGPDTPEQSALMARILALTSGYRAAAPEGLAAHGGFKDWFIHAFRRPGFTIEIGKGRNPLPMSDLPALRVRLREMMTLAALM